MKRTLSIFHSMFELIQIKG